MGYIERIVPDKYSKEDHRFPLIKRKILLQTFILNGVSLLKEAVKLKPNYFKQDIEILKDPIFEKTEYDYIYSLYDMDPINYQELSIKLDELRVLRELHLFIIINFLISHDIAINRMPLDSIEKIQNLVNDYNAIIEKYEIICTDKNLSEKLLEYHSVKIFLENKLNAYYNSISN